jgi:glycine cleavage system transcriptional repressor
MLTLVGEDRPGIVAALTHAIYEGGGNLGEASMMRLGGNFTIMMMVDYDGNRKSLEGLVEPVVASMGLRCHVDHIKGKLHQHSLPDVRISVFGADRAGIVSQVTAALAEAGLNILELESDVAGSEDEPVYIMHIEGHAGEGYGSVKAAVDLINEEGIEASIEPVDTMIG